MATLAEIRAKLKAQDDRKNNAETRTNADKTIYPFWDIKEGTDAIIRFLPDKDQNNTFFWVDRSTINLTFPGIQGQSDSKPVSVRVPCMDMYGMPDPIINETRPWWDVEELKGKAREYWKKKSYIFQGFVVKDGLNETESPENPIRRFIIGPQLYKIIKSALLDPDLGDDSPTDFINGIDFRITKTMKGKYADYSTSTWSRKTRPLSEEELEAIDQHGLYNLADFLPKKPTEIEQAIIKEMFESSVAGEPFDMERWGQYFKPYGAGISADDLEAMDSIPVAKPTPSTQVKVAPAVDTIDDDESPWADDELPSFPSPSAEKSSDNSPDDKARAILDKIKNRQAS